VENREASGWAIFAGIIIFVVGCFNVIYGLAAILNDTVIANTPNGVLIADFTTWGWVTLLIGALLILTALGLFATQGWARWTAVVLATLNAIAQVGLITVFPLWSILIITLDVLIIYNLTVKQGVVQD
jgi:hypothetical protein